MVRFFLIFAVLHFLVVFQTRKWQVHGYFYAVIACNYFFFWRFRKKIVILGCENRAAHRYNCFVGTVPPQHNGKTQQAGLHSACPHFFIPAQLYPRNAWLCHQCLYQASVSDSSPQPHHVGHTLDLCYCPRRAHLHQRAVQQTLFQEHQRLRPPQDEAGLTKTFQTWPRGWFHIP